MDRTRRRLAEELYAASREHDAAQADRLERFRNVEPDTAKLLGVLIRATGARRILELGTSNGYSTIWLADAAQATGGRVLSVDVDASRTELARGNLAAAGLGDQVQLRVEDAASALAGAPDQAWEFVFLDAERDQREHEHAGQAEYDDARAIESDHDEERAARPAPDRMAGDERRAE